MLGSVAKGTKSCFPQPSDFGAKGSYFELHKGTLEVFMGV